MRKRGQVTIFIIIALVIVVFATLFYFFWGDIKPIIINTPPENPRSYLENCLSENISEVANEIASQGGSLKPEHYIVYNKEKIEYLCYSEEYYKQCVVQQPMLKNHIESEIKKAIQSKVDSCLNEMKKDYQDSGYTVNMQKPEFQVDLLPKKMQVSLDLGLTLKKEESKNYNSINILINNNLYELVSIADSIISWETKYGDAETTIYMDYYPYLKVEKYKQTDGTTIYILSDRNTGDKLQFASRSVAWPPGYGTSSMSYNQNE